MKMNKHFTILFFLILLSCNSNPELERFNVGGYSIGDSIDNGISITKVVDEWKSYGVINEYKTAWVILFNNHIEWISIDSLSKLDTDSLKEVISKIYHETSFYIHTNDSSTNSSVPIEEFFWMDTTMGDVIRIYRETQDNPDSISRLVFDNRFMRIKYRDSILGPIEYDFTELSDKE